VVEAEATVAAAASDNAVIAQLTALFREKKDCVLILGAGVHAPPPDDSPFVYPPQDRPPLGRQLSLMLSADCSCDAERPDHEKGDLQRAALCYEVKHGRNGLANKIIEILEPTKPSPLLLALTALPFRFIVTTNFDTLLERALRRHDKEPFVSVYNPNNRERTRNPHDVSAERPLVLKIHGSIDNADSLVITDEDYIQFILRMRDHEPFNPLPDDIEFNLKKRLNLFIGYSLMDYNLRLMFKTMRWGKDDADLPKAYSIDLRPDRLIRYFWEGRRDHIRFVVENHWQFVPRLYEACTGTPLRP
jgi:hypothetical protein